MATFPTFVDKSVVALSMASSTPKVRRKKKLGRHPSYSVVFSITLALFVMGLFGVLLIYANSLSRTIRQNIEVQVYLSKNSTAAEQARIEKTLASQPFVFKDEAGQPALSFISKDEAAQDLIAETGEDFVAFFGENPLRDAFTLRVDPDYQDSIQLAQIKVDIEGINGVFEATYPQTLVNEIERNRTTLGLILLGLSAILLVVVLVLINNTIKLALFSQRFLIRSMQLVGARRSFIQRPFLWRALLYGTVAGVLASAMLYGLLSYAHSRLPELAALQQSQQLFLLFGVLVILGAFIDLASTYRAIRRYLGMALDDLY